MKKKNKIIIAVCVLVAVIAIAGIGSNSSDTGSSSSAGTVKITDSYVNQTTQSYNNYNNSNYNYTTTTQPYSFDSSYDNDYEEQEEAAQWKGTGKSGHVSYITPDDAGLNVRSKAGEDGTLLTTLPEGTSVFFYPQTQTNGYVYCEFTHNNIINGWVLAFYIMDDTAAPQTTQPAQSNQEPQTSYYNSSMGISAPGFVSYNTPDNAGLNVRNAPSSEAALLTTLPEGEKLMYFPDSIQNGYIYCELSGLTGGILYGWLLAEYVMVE